VTLDPSACFDCYGLEASKLLQDLRDFVDDAPAAVAGMSDDLRPTYERFVDDLKAILDKLTDRCKNSVLESALMDALRKLFAFHAQVRTTSAIFETHTHTPPSTRLSHTPSLINAAAIAIAIAIGVWHYRADQELE
jgi:uncharacterized protein (DUF2461 family)